MTVHYLCTKIDDSYTKESCRKEVRVAKITLEAARVNSGLTQQEMADKLGVSRSLVIAWEKGKTEIKPVYLFAICHVTGFNEDEILLPKYTQSEQ